MDLEELRTTDKAAVTVADVASLLGVDPRTVIAACKEGDLPYVKVGRRWLLPVPKLLALFEANVKEHELPAEEALKAPVEQLDLSVKAYNQLKRAGIHTVAQLVECSAATLTGSFSFDGDDIKRTEADLARFGLHLAR